MIYFSILSFRFNSWPEETISVGLIFIDPETNEIKVKISDLKLKIARKILPNKAIFNHFKNYTRSFAKAQWTIDSLDYSARHQNGLVKITRPSESIIKMEDFDQLFERWIERNFLKTQSSPLNKDR
jgi:hypothetical protein